jgi:hypothetical protein
VQQRKEQTPVLPYGKKVSLAVWETSRAFAIVVKRSESVISHLLQLARQVISSGIVWSSCCGFDGEHLLFRRLVSYDRSCYPKKRLSSLQSSDRENKDRMPGQREIDNVPRTSDTIQICVVVEGRPDEQKSRRPWTSIEDGRERTSKE